MRTPTPPELIARIQSLEAEQRRWRRAGGALLALCAALPFVAMAWPRGADADQDAEVLRAQRLEVGEIRLVHDGKTRILLLADKGGTTSISLSDAASQRRAVLAAPADTETLLTLFGPDGGRQHPFLDDVRHKADELRIEADELLKQHAEEIESKLRQEWPDKYEAMEKWLKDIKKQIEAEKAKQPDEKSKGK